VVGSELALRLYSKAGLDPHKLIVWPNALRGDLDPGREEKLRTRRWLYAGRIGREKGILQLVRRWPPGHHLTVVGEGPDLRACREAAVSKHIEFLGTRERTAVLDLMKTSTGLVFPSICLETFPMVYVEAMAAGLPVMAWEPNVVSEFVASHTTGMAIGWGADVSRALERAEATFPSLRERCRRIFEDHFSESRHVARAEALYSELSAYRGA